MYYNRVEICGVNTSELPVLTGKEKRELLEKALTGDKKSRDDFIYANLRLVLSMIQGFNNRGEYVDDLFQVGCVGLIKALDNFDIKQGVQFSTYAVPMIVGEIKRYLRDNNTIRVSRSVRDTAYKSLAFKEQYISMHSKDPTIEEIAKYLDVPKEDVLFALDAIQDPMSLFEPVYQDGAESISIIDQVKDNKNKDTKWVENLAISEGMSKLQQRERNILNLRFFEGKTQMEVADEIGISQAQVSRLEKNALKSIRKWVE